MATLNLKGTIKHLILAPAASGFAYLVVNILAEYDVALGTLTAAQATNYSLITAGVIFASVILLGLDEMIN